MPLRRGCEHGGRALHCRGRANAFNRWHIGYVTFHIVFLSRVDTPDTLTIDEPAFLPPRVQAHKLGRERVKRLCYVE